MDFMEKVTNWFLQDDDDVYRRVEQLKKELHSEYADQKAEQIQDLTVAMQQTDNHEERKILGKAVSLVAEQEREARLEIQTRNDRLQAMVDIQTRR